MKRKIRIAQTVFLPHVAESYFEIEEELIPQFLEDVGAGPLTENNLSEMRNGGIALDTDDEMSVYTITSGNYGEFEVEVEPSYEDWIGVYNLFIEDFGEVVEEVIEPINDNFELN